ncbi:MAG: hypothetical protein LKJ88_04970 [Bacilli bacterium]|jgi:hypothetical protein|nr:hypothetical protein [Bacilli bacterium]
MVKVFLADKAGNRLSKRVGFSWGFLTLGPIWLLAQLRWEGLLLFCFYCWLIPFPGMGRFMSWVKTWNLNEGFYNGLYSFAMYFRSGFNTFPPYLGIALVLAFQIAFAFRCDNWLLGKKIKRKGLSPVTEDDARALIYVHAVKPDVLLAKEKFEKEHLHEQAEKIWEDKNLSYTTMLSRQEMELSNGSSLNGATSEQQARHASNADLLARGIISKEQYEILEKRNQEKGR